MFLLIVGNPVHDRAQQKTFPFVGFGRIFQDLADRPDLLQKRFSDMAVRIIRLRGSSGDIDLFQQFFPALLQAAPVLFVYAKSAPARIRSK